MTRTGNYPYLLLSMVVLGGLYPLLGRGTIGPWIWWVSFWAMLQAAVRVAAKNRREAIYANVFFGIVVVLGFIDRVVGGEPWDHPWLYVLEVGMVVSHLALFAVTGHVMLGDVMRAGRVTTNKIYGAVCFYLLIGVAWAWGYALIGLLEPGSFGAPGAEVGAGVGAVELRDFLYLSFVTLSTVGYGDFVPRSDLARLAATGEGIVGQLFLTILVARLVGLHIAHAGGERDISHE